ncbi:MAG: hypothetical protein AAB071_01770 [Bacteroidota bacterium]
MRNFLCLFFLISGLVTAQEENLHYPLWFLETGRVACPHISVGYATLSPYVHNSILAAKKSAVENYLHLKKFSVKGGQAFWKTERGVISEGNNIKEKFDTTSFSSLMISSVILDSFVSKEIVSVLISISDCNISNSQRNLIKVENENQPQWVSSIPKEKNFVHQVGISQGYSYEISSWENAERHARLNIARTAGNIKIESRGRSSAKSADEIQNEEMEATVNYAEIVARWRDTVENIYYVLARYPSINK